MVDQTVAELILKIIANSSGVSEELEKTAVAQETFSKKSKQESSKSANAINADTNRVRNATEKSVSAMESLGSRLRAVSRSMLVVGTAMSGPIIASMVSASKVSGQVQWTMQKLSNASQDFAVSIARAAAPAVDKLTEVIRNLTKWFNSLTPEMRQSIIQGILMTGVFLIAGGVLLKFIVSLKTLWPIIKAVGGLFVWLRNIVWGAMIGIASAIGWPLTIALGVLTLFATAWVNNWLGIRDLTKTIVGAVGKSIDFLYDKLKTIVLTLQYKHGGLSWKEAWLVASAEVAAARRVMDQQGLGMEQRLKGIADAAAASVDKIKSKLGELAGKGMSSLGGLAGFPTPKSTSQKEDMDNTMSDIYGSVNANMDNLLKQWTNWGSQVSNIVTTTTQEMASTLSTGFFDFLTGEFKSFGEYMADFGKKLLKMITDLITQMLVAWAVKKALGSFGFTFHEGGAIEGTTKHFGGFIKKAHEGLRPGEVPIIAQTGEGVLSRNGMATIGGESGLNKVNAGGNAGGGMVINYNQVISAWGPEDVFRQRKALAGAMIDELQKNGQFRSALRKFR